MKHYFIVNPVSGKNYPGDIAHDLIQPAVLETGIQFEIYTTRYPGDGKRFVKEKCEEAQGQPVRFYAVGGDGTLYEVVNGAAGYPNAEVTCIPKGSGNDYIRLYGGREYFLDVKDLINGRAIAVDGLRLDDGSGVYEYAINQASMGFDAEACAYQGNMKKVPGSIGHITYVLAGLYCMFTKAYSTFACMVDDQPIHGPFFLAAACNSRWYGSGIKVAPFADPCDGLLDCVIIRRDMWWPSLFKLAIYDWQLKGSHYLKRSCLYLRGHKMTCRAEHPVMINVDGETRIVRQVVIEAVPELYRFVVPAHSPYFEQKPDTTIHIPSHHEPRVHPFDTIVNHGLMGYGRKRY
jgi:YegS/Rv2252/BmrU family lipid kinase